MLAPALERGSGCVPGGTGGSIPRPRGAGGKRGCCPTRRTMRRSCKWRTRWASATCSETEGDGAPGGGRGPQGLERQEAVIQGVLTVRLALHSGSRSTIMEASLAPVPQRDRRSPRREGKAAMEQAGRRTQVRAAPRSLLRPRRPFPQQGTFPVGERQDIQGGTS